MDFDSFDPVPLVQAKKKYANFTVKEIGGPAEIIKWRQIQAAKEAAYQIKLNDRDGRLGEFEKETGQKLATPTISTTSWAEKLMFANAERVRLSKAEEKVIAHPPWEPTPEPKKSLIQRVAGFFKSVWKSANF